MHLRRCDDCDDIYKTPVKGSKYCDRCSELRQCIRITKIKIQRHDQIRIENETLLIKYEEQHRRIKENGNTKRIRPN